MAGGVMPIFLESSEMTELRASEDNEADGWKIADQHISRDMHSEQTDSGGFPTLSHEDTLALEAMAANRLKTSKPEPIGEYRKPSFKSSFLSSFDFATVFKHTMIAAIAIGLVVAFYLGLSCTKLGNQTHVARTPEPAHPKVVAPRHVRSAQYSSTGHASGSASTSASAAKASTSKPVVDDAPLPEYKGPSSVTGATVSHRHAYQTIATPAGE
jgi:hypothetical protein